jgi:hypothetical protein
MAPAPVLAMIAWASIQATGTAAVAAQPAPAPAGSHFDQAINLRGGGNRPASDLGPECRGMIAVEPDHRLQWEAERGPLSISIESRADTTLVVRGPDGRIHCIDDVSGLNPVIAFQSPSSGTYDIWMGVYGGAAASSGQLRVTGGYIVCPGDRRCPR